MANCLCTQERVIFLSLKKQAQKTLEWAHKQFATTVHELFHSMQGIINPIEKTILRQSSHPVSTHSIYVLLMTSQSITQWITRTENYDAGAWKVTSYSLDIKNNAFVTMNNDFWGTSEAICQWFSRALNIDFSPPGIHGLACKKSTLFTATFTSGHVRNHNIANIATFIKVEHRWHFEHKKTIYVYITITDELWGLYCGCLVEKRTCPLWVHVLMHILLL